MAEQKIQIADKPTLDKILETIYKDLDYTQSLAFDMYSKKDEDGKIIEYGYWKFPYGYNFYGYISKDF